MEWIIFIFLIRMNWCRYNLVFNHELHLPTPPRKIIDSFIAQDSKEAATSWNPYPGVASKVSNFCDRSLLLY